MHPRLDNSFFSVFTIRYCIYPTILLIFNTLTLFKYFSTLYISFPHFYPYHYIVNVPSLASTLCHGGKS